MIDHEPRWTFAARHTLCSGYGRVHLLGDKVLGCWVCLDRSSGAVLWHRTYWRPDRIEAVAGDVILATDKYGYGCFGISLATGRLLWTSHGNGIWGWFLRALDFIPMFKNELRDSPCRVEGDECFCYSGRVLDVRSGRCRRRVPKPTAPEYLPRPGEWPFGGDESKEVGPGKWLRWEGPSDFFGHRSCRIHLVDDRGSTIWAFDISSTDYFFEPDNGMYAGAYLYLIVSEEATNKPIPGEPLMLADNPTRYHLLTLELDRGTIVGDVLIDERPLLDCKLDDWDEQGLLVRLALPAGLLRDASELKYYARR